MAGGGGWVVVTGCRDYEEASGSFGGDGCLCYRDCDKVFTGACILKAPQVKLFKYAHLIVCQLSANTAVK